MPSLSPSQRCCFCSRMMSTLSPEPSRVDVLAVHISSESPNVRILLLGYTGLAALWELGCGELRPDTALAVLLL